MADAEVERVGKVARVTLVSIGIVAALGVGRVAPFVGLASIIGIARAGGTLVDGVFEVGGAVEFVDFDAVTPCGAVVGGGKVGNVAIASLFPLSDIPSVTVGATTHCVEVGATAVAVAVIDGERSGMRTGSSVDRHHSVDSTR